MRTPIRDRIELDAVGELHVGFVLVRQSRPAFESFGPEYMSSEASSSTTTGDSTRSLIARLFAGSLLLVLLLPVWPRLATTTVSPANSTFCDTMRSGPISCTTTTARGRETG